MQEGKVITTPKHVFEYLGETVRYMPTEEFYMVCLDAKSQVISTKLIAKCSYSSKK